MAYEPKIKSYWGNGIDVTYDVKRCIHAAECVRGLPEVFDTKKRPWVMPGKADANMVAEVVMRCPTGALHFERSDGESEEPVPQTNTIVVNENGPLYMLGDVKVVTADGETLREDTRVALCRCGHSKNKPFCDNSHWKTGFRASGNVSVKLKDSDGWTEGGHLVVKMNENGPYHIRGNLDIRDSDGQVRFRGKKAILCRCGGSLTKPFCDNTHKNINFISE